MAPVTIKGRAIATTFWGQAWCDNMESYRDYENRLPRGRTYVRNGSVVDLQIAPGRVTAVVSGSELYDVTVTIKETPPAHWRSICADCAGGIDSLVELLQGRLSKGVMERLCRQQGGLFPRPSDIRFSCTCPDHALMCKHVAAVLYGVGARLDRQPELLFRLRAVDENDLVAHVDTDLPMSKRGPSALRVLDTDDVSALFGLDMVVPEELAPPKPSEKPKVRRVSSTASKPEGGASAANPIIPRTPHRKRASAGMPPAKPALTKTSPPATKGLLKSAIPKRTVNARALSKSIVLEKGAAPAKVEDRKVPETRERASALHRINPRASVAASNVLEVAVRAPRRSPGSKDQATRGGKPIQKPVKWW